MASLLNRILTLLGHAASDALAQKPSAPSGTSGSTPSGSTETAQSHGSKLSATPSSRGVSVYDVSALGLPAFSYSPDPDGDADPGEVVWAWVPFEEDPSQGKDRPVLVLARHETRLVVAQMTSKDHDRDAAQEARSGRRWMDIGTGEWDPQRRPSEVRINRIIRIDPDDVRRIGAVLDRDIFDDVAAAVRA